MRFIPIVIVGLAFSFATHASTNLNQNIADVTQSLKMVSTLGAFLVSARGHVSPETKKFLEQKRATATAFRFKMTPDGENDYVLKIGEMEVPFRFESSEGGALLVVNSTTIEISSQLPASELYEQIQAALPYGSDNATTAVAAAMTAAGEWIATSK